MPVQFDVAVQVVDRELRKKLPLIDSWRPAEAGPGSFFNSPNRPLLRSPLLLGDDGNLLLAVVAASRKDGGKDIDSWGRFANDGIRVLGSLLHRAATDYGMHRLLIVLLLPEDNEVADGLSSALASSHYTVGQFRVVVLPHCAQPDAVFQSQVEERMRLFSPFPSLPFLEPAADLDLADYVEQALDGGVYESSPFREEVEQDIKLFLSNGEWESGREWPNVMQVLSARMQGTFNKGGM
ncbi:hypothetical protein F0U59_15835 [Archangium gephyra]|nr:hypothetical protein F0U59_15835 [Archangium gephyra]